MSTTFRLLALHTLHNGVSKATWEMMYPILLERGCKDIVDKVSYVKDRHRIDRSGFQILIGVEHDR